MTNTSHQLYAKVQLTESLSGVILKIKICSQEIVNQSGSVTVARTTTVVAFLHFSLFAGWSVVVFHMAYHGKAGCSNMVHTDSLPTDLNMSSVSD